MNYSQHFEWREGDECRLQSRREHSCPDTDHVSDEHDGVFGFPTALHVGALMPSKGLALAIGARSRRPSERTFATIVKECGDDLE